MSRYENERNERNERDESNEHGVTTGTTVGAPVIDMGVTTGTTTTTPTTITAVVPTGTTSTTSSTTVVPVATAYRNDEGNEHGGSLVGTAATTTTANFTSRENETAEHRTTSGTSRPENEATEHVTTGTPVGTPVIDMGVTTGTTTVTPTTTPATPVTSTTTVPASAGTTVTAGRETFRFGVDRENHVTEVSELNEHGQVTATTATATATPTTGAATGATTVTAATGTFTAASGGREVNEVRELNHGHTTFHYSDSDGNGLYVRDYEEWTPATTTGTTTPVGGLLPVISKLTYVATADNDDVAVRNGLVANGGAGTDRFVVREASHMKIGDFHKGESDKLVFDTGLGLQSKAQLASYVTSTEYTGGDFIVHFGNTASVTLVGVNPATVSWDDVTVLS